MPTWHEHHLLEYTRPIAVIFFATAFDAEMARKFLSKLLQGCTAFNSDTGTAR